MILRLMPIILGFCLWGCATPSYHSNFQKLKRDMLKYEVLELVGTPKNARRVRGQDQWAYVFQTNQGLIEKEVYFEGGRVVYAGKPKPLEAKPTSVEPDLHELVDDTEPKP